MGVDCGFAEGGSGGCPPNWKIMMEKKARSFQKNQLFQVSKKLEPEGKIFPEESIVPGIFPGESIVPESGRCAAQIQLA
ncbi:hypothetical protein Tco_0753567 [Tanacetum coccineum]